MKIPLKRAIIETFLEILAASKSLEFGSY